MHGLDASLWAKHWSRPGTGQGLHSPGTLTPASAPPSSHPPQAGPPSLPISTPTSLTFLRSRVTPSPTHMCCCLSLRPHPEVSHSPRRGPPPQSLLHPGAKVITLHRSVGGTPLLKHLRWLPATLGRQCKLWSSFLGLCNLALLPPSPTSPLPPPPSRVPAHTVRSPVHPGVRDQGFRQLCQDRPARRPQRPPTSGLSRAGQCKCFK